VNKAALYSAAFYAFLQMNPLDFLSLLGIGIVLAYLVFKTGSLLLPVASQIIYALASLIYLNIAAKNQFLDLPPWPEAIIYLILALFGLYLGVRLTDYFYEEEK
jgi:membrane protease YdiL (CAAX protease family)